MLDEARSTLDAALLDEHPQTPDLWRARLLFEEFAGDAGARGDRALARSDARVRAGAGSAVDPARPVRRARPGRRRGSAASSNWSRDIPRPNCTSSMTCCARPRRRGAARGKPARAGAGPRRQAQPAPAAGPLLRRAPASPTLPPPPGPNCTPRSSTERLPLPEPSPAITQWPELAPLPEPAPGVLLLWGAPGSLVERLAMTFDQAGAPLRADRFGAQPPSDPLQRYPTVPDLLDSSLDPAYMVSLWRAALPYARHPRRQRLRLAAVVGQRPAARPASAPARGRADGRRARPARHAAGLARFRRPGAVRTGLAARSARAGWRRHWRRSPICTSRICSRIA